MRSTLNRASLFLGIILILMMLWAHYKPSPQTEETLLNNELTLHGVINSKSNLTFGDLDYSNLLDHEFPNCQGRTIYNGNAEYSLPDIIKFIREYIPPPSDFVAHLKNPCWFANYDKVISDLNDITKSTPLPKANGTKTLYCLPYLYLLGYPKCGTSSLHAYFTKHPEFANTIRGYGWIGSHTSGLVDKYPANLKSVFDLLSRFYPASRLVELSSSDNHVDNKIIADFNPSNSWRHSGFEQLKNGSICDPPLLLRELQPDAKFVVLLREPINRLYSAFWYYADKNYQKKLSPEIFTEDVQTFFKRLELCDKRKSMLKCLREAQVFAHHFRDCCTFKKNPQQLLASFYYLYLLPWLQVFPRRNFIFIRTEDMKKDTRKILQEIFQFLGMSLLPEDKMNSIVKIIANEQTLLHSNDSNSMLLSASIKERLRVYFRPFNEKLAKLLNDDRFLWDNTE